MVILLTGRSGYIGRNLHEQMAGRYKILAPLRQELDLMDSDGVRRYLEQHLVDAVIHCATTPGHRNAPLVPDLAARNIRMFLNFARSRHLFRKMIYLGSGAIYDMRYYTPRVREDDYDNHVPVDDHGFSKYVIAKLVQSCDNIVELRLFGVFGKYEDYAIRFISNAICKALYGLPITLKQNRRFDYVYVDDLTQVIDHFLHNQWIHKCYNVTSDETIELKAVAELVKESAARDIDIVIQQPGLGLEYSGDNARLKSAMGKLPFAPLSVSVKKLFKWYKENFDSIDKTKLLVDK
ncbi:MAG: epimerase [Betaproteobacteria bacterium RIFCSPLOWO2_12_FULL_62_58]|nr:MAG: epimerase [Betaproteobacteria bacterium RIFCSPLOWO2_12_FULL_62_58]